MVLWYMCVWYGIGILIDKSRVQYLAAHQHSVVGVVGKGTRPQMTLLQTQ